MEVKLKSLKKKYENLKWETIDILTKMEYLKTKKAYDQKKIEFLQGVLNKFAEIYDIKELKAELQDSEEDEEIAGTNPYKKMHF